MLIKKISLQLLSKIINSKQMRNDLIEIDEKRMELDGSDGLSNEYSFR